MKSSDEVWLGNQTNPHWLIAVSGPACEAMCCDAYADCLPSRSGYIDFAGKHTGYAYDLFCAFHHIPVTLAMQDGLDSCVRASSTGEMYMAGYVPDTGKPHRC